MIKKSEALKIFKGDRVSFNKDVVDVVIRDRIFQETRHTDIMVVLDTSELETILFYFINDELFSVNGEISLYNLQALTEPLENLVKINPKHA